MAFANFVFCLENLFPPEEVNLGVLVKKPMEKGLGTDGILPTHQKAEYHINGQIPSIPMKILLFILIISLKHAPMNST